MKFIAISFIQLFSSDDFNHNYFKVKCNGAFITTAVDLNTQITLNFKKKVPLKILNTNKKFKISLS